MFISYLTAATAATTAASGEWLSATTHPVLQSIEYIISFVCAEIFASSACFAR